MEKQRYKLYYALTPNAVCAIFYLTVALMLSWKEESILALLIIHTCIIHFRFSSVKCCIAYVLFARINPCQSVRTQNSPPNSIKNKISCENLLTNFAVNSVSLAPFCLFDPGQPNNYFPQSPLGEAHSSSDIPDRHLFLSWARERPAQALPPSLPKINLTTSSFYI